MMRRTPAIALRRKQQAINNFVRKLEILEEFLATGAHERLPKRVTLSSFADWNDTALGVHRLARSVLYNDTDEYLVLRRRLDCLLQRILRTRVKQGKKETLVQDLQRRLEEAEERAQSYVNQISLAMASLDEARNEIERLKNKVQRNGVHLSRIVSLHQSKSDVSQDNTSPTPARK